MTFSRDNRVLHKKQGSAKFQLSHDIVNFKILPTNRPFSRQVTLKNVGKRSGSFFIALEKIEDENAEEEVTMEFSPKSGTVDAGEAVQISFGVKVSEPCDFNQTLKFTFEGVAETDSPAVSLQVIGKFVVQELIFLVEDVSRESMSFGPVYYGQKKTVTCKLVNSGPLPLPFQTNISKIEMFEGLYSQVTRPEQSIEDDNSVSIPLNTVTVQPYGGRVAPFSSEQIQLTFNPPKFQQNKGFLYARNPEKFTNTYFADLLIECEELQTVLRASLDGLGVAPGLKTSPDYLFFGRCPVGQRRDLIVTLHNDHSLCSLDWEVPPTAQIRVDPPAGKLTPRQSADVLVTFIPKTMGTHRIKIPFLQCKKSYVTHLNCQGEAPSLDKKATEMIRLPKTIEDTCKDFQPSPRYVDLDNIQDQPLSAQGQRKLSITKLMKISMTEEISKSLGNALDTLVSEMPAPNKFTLAPSAFQALIMNRQRYNNYIRNHRTKRLAKEKNKGKEIKPRDIFFENDPDIGLLPGGGLKSPRVSLDEIPYDKLWQNRGGDGKEDSGQSGVTGMRYIHDDRKLIRKKFKSHATTQAEVRDCTARLENWQLALVSCGPKMIDFGRVFVKSTVTKNFSVFNDLPASVMVTLNFEGIEELQKSTPSSQVVPSATAAGFDITLNSLSLQTFHRYVMYTINGIHSAKLLIKAEVSPVQLDVSRSELNMRFTDVNLEKHLSEPIVLFNKGNATGHFSWAVSEAEHFSVTPSSGSIQPGSNFQCEIVFIPPHSGQTINSFLTLKVVDGNEQVVRVSAAAPESQAQFTQKKIDFGLMPVGMKADSTLGIHNNGKNPTVFHLMSAPDGVTVQPTRGRVSPDSKVELAVSLATNRAERVESSIVLSIRGGKPIKIPLTYQVVAPVVEIEQAEIAFGELTLGAVATQPITLLNTSQVEATIYVDLSSYPEFVLAGDVIKKIGARKEDPVEPTDSSSFLPISQRQLNLEINPQEESQQVASPSSAPAVPEADEEEKSVYRLVIPPDSVMTLSLTFQPQELGTQVFELPIIPAGGGKPPEALRRVVQAQASRPRVLFSTTSFDFKTKIIATDNQLSVPDTKDVMMHNADSVPTRWMVDTKPLQKYQSVFQIDPNEGVLGPEQDCPIRASFLPNEPIAYSVEVPVYISYPATGKTSKNNAQPLSTEKPYLFLRVKGTGSVPRLTFDRREVAFPPVPIGVATEVTFKVINEGYEAVEVSHSVEAGATSGVLPLKVEYPEGSNLGVSKAWMPVTVHFESKRAMSFCAKLEFTDGQGRTFSIPICGTCDNSLLTLWPYLEAKARGEDSTKVLLPEESSGEPSSPPQTASFSAPFQDVPSNSLGFLVRWMNCSVVRTLLENFPKDLIAQQGRHLQEILDTLGGKAAAQDKENKDKKKDKKDKEKETSKPRELEKIEGLVTQYEQILNTLRRHGAMLATVKPEHFLSQEMYVKYVQTQSPSLNSRSLERQHAKLSPVAWLTTVLQAVKVFWLARITPKMFKNTPGMTDGRMEDHDGERRRGEERRGEGRRGEGEERREEEERRASLGAPLPTSIESPVLQACIDTRGLGDHPEMSLPEQLLLKWVTFHYKKVFLKVGGFPEREISDFSSCLSDGIVLSALILSHCPYCSSVCPNNLSIPCSRDDEREGNCARVVSGLKEIELNFPIQSNDIANAKARDMVLFVSFLYDHLPHFIPKSTIVFPCSLGGTASKIIEISNPVKRALTYAVKTGALVNLSQECKVLSPKKLASGGVDFKIAPFSVLTQAFGKTYQAPAEMGEMQFQDFIAKEGLK